MFVSRRCCRENIVRGESFEHATAGILCRVMCVALSLLLILKLMIMSTRSSGLSPKSPYRSYERIVCLALFCSGSIVSCFHTVAMFSATVPAVPSYQQLTGVPFVRALAPPYSVRPHLDS